MAQPQPHSAHPPPPSTSYQPPSRFPPISTRLDSLNSDHSQHSIPGTTLGPPINSTSAHWSSPAATHQELGWMTPLPSPLDAPGRPFFDMRLPSGGGAVVGGVDGRNRAVSNSSVFAEFNQPTQEAEQQPASPTDGARANGGPTRSKTLSFFDTASAITSPTVALSPPPNPPSRNGSLSRREPQARSSSGGSWLDRAREATSDSEDLLLSPSPLRQPPSAFNDSPSKLTSSPEQEVTAKPNARFLSFGRPGSSLAPQPESPRAVSLPTSLLSLQSPAGSPSGSVSPRRAVPALSVAIPRAPILQPQPPKPVEDEGPIPQPGDQLGEYEVERILGRGAFSRVVLAKWKGKQRAGQPEEAALKLITKKSYVGNERMRNSVVREVQVLKNINHPSLSSLLASFPTPLYTVLALDYCPGGELFDFLAEWHKLMPEPLARRIFGELAAAVGWMHSIGLVHRDIKLENILLTSRPFPCANPENILASLPTPFIKLTDFGLSRFVSPSDPPLTTRCGSEEYAAPELLLGKPYNGRKTDSWALGVCFYALITGVLPFVDPGQETANVGSSLSSSTSTRGRRSYLLKIAKGEFAWPGSTSAQSPTSPYSPINSATTATALAASAFSEQSQHLVSPSARALVGRLLERDSDKRAKVEDVWDMEWMQGEGRLTEEERKAGRVRVPEALGEGGVEGDPLEEEWQRV